MKNILLVSAIAAATTFSSAGSAYPIISDVTGVQLLFGTNDLLDEPESRINNFQIGGDTVTGVTIEADLVAYTTGTLVYIDMQLTDGLRQGVNGSGGTVFTGGQIFISTSSDGGTTITPFDTIDASVTNIPFLAGADGHLAPTFPQTTAGLVIEDDADNSLPGLWDMQVFGENWDGSVGSIELFGQDLALYIEGQIGWGSEVPVPAAAWLFGSALLGLGGLGRSRSKKR